MKNKKNTNVLGLLALALAALLVASSVPVFALSSEKALQAGAQTRLKIAGLDAERMRMANAQEIERPEIRDEVRARIRNDLRVLRDERQRLVPELKRLRLHLAARLNAGERGQEHSFENVRSLIEQSGLTEDQKKLLVEGLKTQNRVKGLLDERRIKANFVMWSDAYDFVAWGKVVPFTAKGFESKTGERVKFWYANGVFVGLHGNDDVVWGTYGDNNENVFTLQGMDGMKSSFQGHYLVYNQQ